MEALGKEHPLAGEPVVGARELELHEHNQTESPLDDCYTDEHAMRHHDCGTAMTLTAELWVDIVIKCRLLSLDDEPPREAHAPLTARRRGPSAASHSCMGTGTSRKTYCPETTPLRLQQSVPVKVCMLLHRTAGGLVSLSAAVRAKIEALYHVTASRWVTKPATNPDEK